ncbi:MAG: nucleoside deaminase, partial [Clostridiales bacterium]|nr:nucleoside deaminase [Clostridiales bacterium]
WNLSDCDLFVTMEPCVMCSGAIVYARIRTVYYGTVDLRFGCCGTVMNLAQDPRFNHRAEVVGGILQEECVAPIKAFFRQKRAAGKRKFN